MPTYLQRLKPRTIPGLLGRATLSLLALNLGASSAATPTSTINVVDTFNPNSTGVGGVTTYQVIITSTEGQPLTGLGLDMNLSPALQSLSSFTTTCGGTVSFSGTTATFSGGTLPPANPDPVSCTVQVTGTAVNTAGNRTVTIPAQAIVTNQNLTNVSGSASTLSLSSLTAAQLSVTGETLRADDSVAYNTAFSEILIQGERTRIRLKIRNNNSISLNNARVEYQPLRFAGLPTLESAAITGASCGASLASIQSGATVNVSGTTSDLITFTGLNIAPSSTCELVIEGPLSKYPDESSSEGATPDIEITSMQGRLRLVSNDTSPTANTATDSFISVRKNMTLALSVDGLSSYNLQSRASGPYPTRLTIANSGFGPRTISGTMSSTAFPTFGPTTVVSGAGCPAISLGGAFNATLPAETTCVYESQTSSATGSISVLNNTLTISGGPATSRSGASINPAANVNLTSSPVISATHRLNDFYGTGISSSWNVSRLTISNSSFIDANNLAFDLNWGGPSAMNEAIRSNTCGGTIGFNPTRQTLSLSGGVIPNRSSCVVELRLEPSSTVPAGPRTVTLTNLSSDAGTLASQSWNHNFFQPFGGSGKTTVTNSFYGGELVSGVMTPYSISYGTSAAYDRSYRHVITVPATVNLDFSSASWKCSNFNGDYLARPINPGEVQLSGSTLTVQPPLQPGLDRNSSVGGHDSGTGSRCTLQFRLSDTTGRYLSFPGTVDAEATSPFTTFDYNVIASKSYNLNMTFSPQNVVAGGTSTLTYSASNSAGGSDPALPSVQIVNTLPVGLSVTNASGAPNQPDGRYLSGTQATTWNQLGEPCLEISADRRQVTLRCLGAINSIQVVVTRYGDLINTVTPAEFQAVTGQLSAAASATVKASIGVPVSLSLSPASGKANVARTLSVTVTNARPSGDPDNTIQIPLTSALTPNAPSGMNSGNLSPSGPVSAGGNCPPSSANWNGSQLVISGLTLASDQSCTLTYTLYPSASSPTTFNQGVSITGSAVTSSIGGTNPQPASVVTQVIPFATCAQVTGPMGITPLTRGLGRSIPFTLTNLGEVEISNLRNNLTLSTSVSAGSPAYLIRIGSASASTNAQTALSNYLNTGPLAPGDSVTGEIIFNTSSSTPAGTQAVTLTSAPSGTGCGSYSATLQGILEPRGDGVLTLTQAACTPATCAGATFAPATLSAGRCENVALRLSLTALNGPLYRAQGRLVWPAGLTWISANGQATPSAPLLWQVGSAAPTSTPPNAVTAGETVKVWADRDGSGTLTDDDVLRPGETVEVTFYTEANC